MISEEDIKNSKFLKFTFTLNMIYFSYKDNGFIKGTKQVFCMLFMSVNKWLFNHCKWYEKFLRKRARRKAPEMEIVLDMFFSNKPFDFREHINSTPAFKEYFINNFDKYKEDVVNKMTEGKNMSEKEIEEFRNSIKLEDYIKA